MVHCPRRSRLYHAAAGSLIGMWVSITLSRLREVTGFSSDNVCPEETVFCLADIDRSACLDTLQARGIPINPYADCSEWRDEGSVVICSGVRGARGHDTSLSVSPLLSMYPTPLLSSMLSCLSCLCSVRGALYSSPSALRNV